ncbi:MAG: CHAT domain-containing protein [Anaerolineae bacterium]|nr:CHAT domain-containing protein [Anaerolineae bacterium]
MKRDPRTAGRRPQRLSIALGLLTLLALWCLDPPPGRAQGPEGEPQTFDDGQAPGWTLERNTRTEERWEVVPLDARMAAPPNQALRGIGHVFATYEDRSWADYVLRARIYLLEPGSTLHICYRMSNQGRYFIGFAEWGLYLSKESPWGAPATPSLAQVNRLQTAGRWYAIEVRGVGSTIEVFVNGSAMIRYEDKEPLRAGTIGFETLDNSIVFVDDVEVEVYASMSARPPECPQDGPRYEEDLDDGRAQGWAMAASGERWQVQRDMLVGRGHTWASYEDAQWGDVCLAFTLRCLQAQLHANVRHSAKDRYAVYLLNDGSRLFVGLAKGERADQRVAEADVDLSPFTVDQWTEQGLGIAIQALGNEVRVSVQGAAKNPVLVYRDPDPLPAGQVSFEAIDSTVCVDDIVVVGEPEEAPLPDLAPHSLHGWVSEDGDELYLMAQVRNAGPEGSGAAVVRAEAWDRRELSLPPLSPGKSHALTFQWDIPDEKRGRFVVIGVHVDPDNRIAEQDEQNNDALAERIVIPTVRAPGVPTSPKPTPVPPTSRPTPVPPTPRPTPQPRNRAWLYGGGGVVALVVAVLLYRALRPKPEGEPPGREPEDAPPPVVPVPPMRLIRMWLTEGQSGTGRRISDAEALQLGAPYCVHLQIRSTETEDVGDRGAHTPLDVVLFSPGGDFSLERRRDVLQIGERGHSDEIHIPIQPLQSGPCRLRACVYHGNVLLQSAVLDATAAAPGERPQDAGTERLIDYLASLDLRRLDAYPQPDLSIVVNQDRRGRHWIGVYRAGDRPGPPVRSGAIVAVEDQAFAVATRQVRDWLFAIEGDPSYNYVEPFSAVSPQERERWMQDLVELAGAGWDMFYTLLCGASLGAQGEEDLRLALRQSGAISIAHCGGDEASIPWAAMYDLPIDTGRLRRVRLCPHFERHLTAGAELPDNQRICAQANACPLQGDQPKLVVCPFGFWGFLHQIGQPLQGCEGFAVDAEHLPEELQTRTAEQTSYLVHNRAEAMTAVVAVDPTLDSAEGHYRELAQLLGHAGMSPVDLVTDRDQMIEVLEEGDRHLYYFYCHGEQRGVRFGLLLGPEEDPAPIYASNLAHVRWGEPRPLVVLNGCETLAPADDQIHLLLHAFRTPGASGVIGTQIKVKEELAQQVGQLVLAAFFGGCSIGEAFLAMRRRLLRDGNPLGLAYSCHAPASLHVHDSTSCAWCASHPNWIAP